MGGRGSRSGMGMRGDGGGGAGRGEEDARGGRAGEAEGPGSEQDGGGQRGIGVTVRMVDMTCECDDSQLQGPYTRPPSPWCVSNSKRSLERKNKEEEKQGKAGGGGGAAGEGGGGQRGGRGEGGGEEGGGGGGGGGIGEGIYPILHSYSPRRSDLRARGGHPISLILVPPNNQRKGLEQNRLPLLSLPPMDSNRHHMLVPSDKKGVSVKRTSGMLRVSDDMQQAQPNGSAKDTVSSKKSLANTPYSGGSYRLQGDSNYPPPLIQSISRPERLSAITMAVDTDSDDEGFSHQVAREAVKRVEEVESELKHANDQLAKMKNELAHCTKDLEGAKTQRYYLVSAANDATSAKAAMDKSMELVRRAVEEKSRGLESTEAALHKSKLYNRKLQAEIDRLRREVEGITKRFEATVESLESTRQAKEEAYRLAEEYKRMLTEEMDSQMRGDEERTLRWEAALENANRQYREAVEKIRSQQRVLEEARDELRAARDESRVLQTELDTLKEQHKAAVEGVAKLRQALKDVTDQRREASEGASSLRVDLIEAREDTSLAEKRVKSLQAEIERLQGEVRGAEERERRLQREVEEVKRAKAAVKGTGEGRKQVVDELEAKLDLAQQARAESEARAERAETEARIARVAEARAKAMAGAAESRMKATLKESEMRLAAAIEEAEARVSAAQREVVACRQSEAKAVATFEAMKKETMEERKRYQAGTAEAEEVSALAKMAREEMEITTLRSREAEQRAEARVREMKTRVQAAESQARTLKEELSLLQGQLRGLKMQFDTLMERAEEEAMKAKEATEELASLKKHMRELEEREREAVKRAEQAESEKLVVEDELEMLKAAAESARGKPPTVHFSEDPVIRDNPTRESKGKKSRSKHRQSRPAPPVHRPPAADDEIDEVSSSREFKFADERLRRTSKALTRVVTHQPRCLRSDKSTHYGSEVVDKLMHAFCRVGGGEVTSSMNVAKKGMGVGEGVEGEKRLEGTLAIALFLGLCSFTRQECFFFRSQPSSTIIAT
ncbi:hypothetical protein CBR_g40403 [Chara braunii]|uniref:Uncharacterized protein n=1 Tax=Chara braunii TaxID=69332 RepID=A0A388LTS7_CHABU|nr:hypothetical protein CBR_g40403 [Chara braunii]|eukprot:GBG85671.1 hypothetical protein CBR_g40403 [Chara braunii]